MATERINVTVNENTNNNVKEGEGIMKSVTLSKKGVGSVGFAFDGTHYFIRPLGLEDWDEVTEEYQKSQFSKYLQRGFSQKVEKTPKKDAPKDPKTSKTETPRFKWNKEGRRIWATQYNIYKRALQDAGYAKNLKGKEYHDAIDKVCKAEMKTFEAKMASMVNQMI